MFHHALMGGYLKPTQLKPYMTYDHHHSTSAIKRKCKDKGHISYPQEKPQSSQGGEGEGGQDGYITLGGWGGGPAKPGSYIYIYNLFQVPIFISIISSQSSTKKDRIKLGLEHFRPS